MIRPLTFIFTLILLRSIAQSSSVVLYDPNAEFGVTQTPPEQGWGEVSTDFSDLTGFYSRGDQVTNIDTTDDRAIAAGFYTHDGFTGNVVHPDAPILDAEAGFTLHFHLAIDHIDSQNAADSNGDGKKDDGGFAISLLANDKSGIGITWLESSIFSAEDDRDDPADMFTQGEVTRPIGNLGELHHYALTFLKGAYRLDMDGELLIHGRRRNYENDPGVDIFGANLDPWDKPNSIIFGDGSANCDVRARLSSISVETSHQPDFAMDPQVEIIGSSALRVTWNSIPGFNYQIESSADMKSWVVYDPVEASLFVTSSELEISEDSRLYIRVALLEAD